MTIGPTHPRNFIKKNLSRIIQYTILSVMVVVIFTPIVMVVFAGLKTRGMAILHPYTLPIPPQWDNFASILASSSSYWVMLRNSLVVMVGTTSIVLIVCSLAAFIFARVRFRGKELVFNMLTLGLMFPITIAILPVFLVIRQLNLTDNLMGIILVQTAFQISLNTLILRGFFMTIPGELQDAAYIDGCSDFQFFYKILLPLARPGLAAVAALTMIASWNDLLVPLVLIDRETLWTLPLGTMQFQGQYGADLSLISAFVFLSAVPSLIFYLISERQIVSGLTAGAIKG